jgi:hypothetical protein
MMRHLVTQNNTFTVREDKEHLKRIREARIKTCYGEGFEVVERTK